MALSQAAQMAKQELEQLNTAITEAESNLRILAALGSDRRLEVMSKLQKAVARRDQVLAAINAEDQR